MKTDDVYRFDSSNYEIDRPLPIRKKCESDLINGR